MYPDKLGLNKKSYFTTEMTFGRSNYSVGSFTEKSYSIKMHAQEFYEINIVLGGEGMHYIGEVRLPAGEGDVFIIPPESMHGYVGGEGFDVHHILLSPRFFEKHAADLANLPAYSSLFMVEPAMRERFSSDLHLTLTKSELSELIPLLNAITECDSPRPDERLIRQSLTLVLIARLSVEFAKHLTARERLPRGDDEAFMQSIAYIYEKYSEKITIDTLARIARMSRTAYLVKFKRFTGTSPGEFIMRYRTETAAQLLTSTSRTVSDIAAMTGFYDPPHLIRVFTERMGMTPTEYRRQS